MVFLELIVSNVPTFYNHWHSIENLSKHRYIEKPTIRSQTVVGIRMIKLSKNITFEVVIYSLKFLCQPRLLFQHEKYVSKRPIITSSIMLSYD